MDVRNFMMVILLLFVALVITSHEVNGQLDEKIDEITYQWDLEAVKLSTYEGLLLLCRDREYRNHIISLLEDIHHLDSVLRDVLVRLSKTGSDMEVKRTLKDIEKFEIKYDTRSFIYFMIKECKAAGHIEKNSSDTRNEVGVTSYSGQVHILETELYKYVHNVTHRVDKIRTHVHHLNLRYE